MGVYFLLLLVAPVASACIIGNSKAVLPEATYCCFLELCCMRSGLMLSHDDHDAGTLTGEFSNLTLILDP